MNFDVLSVNVAILLLTVNDVASFPQPSVSNAGRNPGSNHQLGVEKHGGGSVKGSVKNNDTHVKGHMKIQSDAGRKPLNQREGDALSGSVEIDDKNIQGHVNIPKDVENQQYAGVVHENDAISGTLEIGDENIQGDINLPSESNNQQNGDGVHDGGTISGNVEIDDTNIEGHINLPSDHEKQQHVDGVHEGGTISGSVEKDDKNIQGHVNIPSDVENQQYAGVVNENDAVSGTLEIDNENIQGDINLPSESKNQQHGDGVHEGGTISGSVELDDKNIEGHVNLPSDHEKQQHSDDVHEGGVITGSIEKDDENIQGHINIPTDVENQPNTGVVHENDAVSGTLEIDDENIQGDINLPSESNNQQNEDGVHEGGTISGSVDIDDKNIEGHVNLPSDHEKQQHADGVHEGGTISGSVEKDDKNIQGHVNIPSDVENQQYAGVVNENDAISGSLEIDDENIQANINLPSESKNQQHGDGVHEGGTISGSGEIDDKNIEGHINLPSDRDSKNVSAEDDDESLKEKSHSEARPSSEKTCWMNLKSKHYLDALEKLDAKYSKVRQQYQDEVGPEFDKKMMEVLLNTGGVAPRAMNQAHGDVNQIPAGINLGGYCMMRMPGSLLYPIFVKGKGTREQILNVRQIIKKAQEYKIPVIMCFIDYRMAFDCFNWNSLWRVLTELGVPEHLIAILRTRFFHRMKLRNSTQFRVNYLSTQLNDMTLVARLSLHDLHLRGAYERSTTDRDPSVMYYVPSFGELDVLLKNVVYKMEGHIRMLDNRLIVELVNSDLVTNDILLTYINDSSSSALRLQPRNLEDFLERLKVDLDFWMKDYFNDYLMYFGIVKSEKNSEIQMYEKQKTIKVNEYADFITKAIQQRLKNLGAVTVQLPHFTIMSVFNNQIKLKSGRLRGLDSIYRRSVATTNKDKEIRQVDFMVGFSKLKVEYQYEAMVTPGMPPVTGMLVLSADELVAHIEVSQLVGSDTFDLTFDSIVQTKPESLTVEGPANRLIADFRHVLEHPIIAIMTNIMKHNIKMLKSLTRCVPYIKGDDKDNPNKVNKHHNKEIPADHAENKIDDGPYGVPKDFGDEDVPSAPVESLVTEEHNENKKEWSDYVFSKNDSVELEVPINSEIQKMKLDRKENFVLSKIP